MTQATLKAHVVNWVNLTQLCVLLVILAILSRPG